MSESSFRCSHCGCSSYEQITLAREGRAPYALPFFACCGCGVLFRDALVFTRKDPRLNVERAAEPRLGWPVGANDGTDGPDGKAARRRP